ncbi:MAG: hypothetical protein M3Q33_01460 [Acidobacteriota bacterium]|nr:hypothetical protein [Acidobacteriota bacterium]
MNAEFVVAQLGSAMRRPSRLRLGGAFCDAKNLFIKWREDAPRRKKTALDIQSADWRNYHKRENKEN